MGVIGSLGRAVIRDDPWTRELPPGYVLPNERYSLHDRDDFIRNLYTVVWGDWAGNIYLSPDWIEILPSASALDRPLITLEQIKAHLRIEIDIDDEDDYLMMLEAAAHLHVENYLQYTVDDTVGENIKTAALLLLANWYRNREAVTSGTTNIGQPLPFGVEALLYPERDWPRY